MFLRSKYISFSQLAPETQEKTHVTYKYTDQLHGCTEDSTS